MKEKILRMGTYRIKPRLAALGVAVFVLVGGGTCWAASGLASVGSKVPSAFTEQQSDKDKSDAQAWANGAKCELKIHVNAANWTQASTQAVARIENKAGDCFYHAFSPNSDHSIEVKSGTYRVSYLSPINEDGSIYQVLSDPESTEATDLDNKSNAEQAIEATNWEIIPTSQVTREQLDVILDALQQACEQGDETLEGEAGKNLLDLAKTNASAWHLDNNTSTQADSEQTQGTPDTATAASNPSSVTSSGNQSTGATEEHSDNVPANTNSSACQHNWRATEEYLTYPDEYEAYEVPDYVYIGRYTCSHCGLHTYTSEEASSHQREEALALGSCYSYYSDGYYEQQGNHIENVLVRPSWSQMTVTGLTCTKCGATS